MMELVELPIRAIVPAEWNPNEMDEAMRSHLSQSLQRFGIVVPLVVREVGEGRHETIGGAQRLAALQEMGADSVPCVLVQADDVEARLLSQSLNHIAGEDNLGLRSKVLNHILAKVPKEEVIAILPETAESLEALSSLGQEDIAAHLRAWQKAQAARLKHFAVQLTPPQMEVVDEALGRFLPDVAAGEEGNPNRRGLALHRLCLTYLQLQGDGT